MSRHYETHVDLSQVPPGGSAHHQANHDRHRLDGLTRLPRGATIVINVGNRTHSTPDAVRGIRHLERCYVVRLTGGHAALMQWHNELEAAA